MRFRYRELGRVAKTQAGRLDIMLTISIPGGLRVWPSWQRFVRQYVGGHRDQEEKYHSMI
jgi:hypothetical protein